MIKKFSVITIFSLFAAGLFISPASSKAAEFNTEKAGEKFSFPTTTGFSFQPSPQVIILGNSDGEAFAVGAAHLGSFDKANGNAYMMHSAASGIFFQSLSEADGGDDAAVPDMPALDEEVDKGTMTGGWKLEGASG